jgi:hypothetical protein
MHVSIAEAQNRLPELIRAVEAGEEVIIIHGVKSFELLFETSIVADTAKNSKLVASRHLMKYDN